MWRVNAPQWTRAAQALVQALVQVLVQALVQTLVTSHLDYRPSLLAGLPAVAARIRFKTLVLGYCAENGSGPVYIQDMTAAEEQEEETDPPQKQHDNTLYLSFLSFISSLFPRRKLPVRAEQSRKLSLEQEATSPGLMAEEERRLSAERSGNMSLCVED
ncbi:unnamed protein product [Pleuronectes platessa]|uniref:Uncharacterized protein n=1 Tax=Pleuronectes platessa TaxID=8262 RepID=A0A9N7Z9F7_PLEPL|nr:unnamed protein product [Pleuronectes platessa]